MTSRVESYLTGLTATSKVPAIERRSKSVGDDRDARVIEDAVATVRHFHWRTVAPVDVGGQFLSKDANSLPSGVGTCVGSAFDVFASHRGNRSRSGNVLAVSQGNPPRSRVRRNAGRLSPSTPCHPIRAASTRQPDIDFTGNRKIASTCQSSEESIARPVRCGCQRPRPRPTRASHGG
jgi:hypothetical protein